MGKLHRDYYTILILLDLYKFKTYKLFVKYLFVNSRNVTNTISINIGLSLNFKNIFCFFIMILLLAWDSHALLFLFLLLLLHHLHRYKLFYQIIILLYFIQSRAYIILFRIKLYICFIFQLNKN